MVSHQQLALDQVEVNINSNSNSSSLSLISHKTEKPGGAEAEEESDEDLFMVPDVESSGQAPNVNSNSNGNTAQNQKRRRGRNPVDKEYRRLKSPGLLRNRVSAQQARERKKVYVNDLELRAKELQDTNSVLEDKISTLLNENNMLRKVLLNTRPKVDESSDQKQQN